MTMSAGHLQTRPPPDVPGAPLAAIDVGTSSIHLLVARPAPGGRLVVLAQEKEPVRLGAGSQGTRRLHPAAIERGLRALRRFAAIARHHGALVRAVATSAVREAANRREFVARARAEAGVTLEVISGEEEARLTFLGVLDELAPAPRTRILLADIGGGSTEVLLARGPEVLRASSVCLGAVRISESHLAREPLAPAAVERCRREVRRVLGAALGGARPAYDIAAGSSGTIRAAARMARAAGGTEPAPGLPVLSRSDLDQVLARLLRAPTAAERRSLPGLEAHRADVIVGGVLILEQLMDLLEIDRLVACRHGLREGVIAARVCVAAPARCPRGLAGATP